jgi:hypothetical protein
MRGLYDISIMLLGLGIYVASFFNKKAKQRIKTGDAWKTTLPSGPYDLWMHCAS